MENMVVEAKALQEALTKNKTFILNNLEYVFAFKQAIFATIRDKVYYDHSFAEQLP